MDHQEHKPVRLNLGAGSQPLDDFINLDGAKGDVIYPLNYSEVDEIRASHVLEHFGYVESQHVLKDWIKCLKVGGVLKIAVPNFTLIANNLDKLKQFEQYVMGGQVDELDYHKSLWYTDKLEILLKHFGLTDIEPWESEVKDCASFPISLNLKGVKHGERRSDL